MSDSQTNFDQAMTKGHTAAWDQDWKTAAEYYRQALKFCPEHPKALVSLGLAYYELGKFEQSLSCYAKITQLNPNDPVSFEKVAQISERLGRSGDVIRASLKAAELYMRAGDSKRAIENLVRVTNVDGENLAAHSRLAYIYERKGSKGKAVTEYLMVASLLQRKGEIKNARKAIIHALEIVPDNKESLEALNLLENGKPLPKPIRSVSTSGLTKVEAHEDVQFESQSPKATPGKDPIEEARDRALAELAEIILEAASEEEKKGDTSPRGLGSLMRGAPRMILSRKIDNVRLQNHLNQAITYQSLGQREEAQTELEKAVEIGLIHPAAYFDLGLLYSQGERLESAVRNLQKATSTEDYALAAHLLIGSIFIRLGRSDEAVLEYLKALQYADAWVVPEDRAEEVFQLYEPIIESERNRTEVQEKQRICETIADLLMRPDWKHRLLQTRKDFQIDIAEGPAIPLGEVFSQASGSRIVDAIINIHRLARAGHLRSAMEEAFHALQYAPTYLPLHSCMGELLLQQDRISEAVAKFNTIARTYRARGDVLYAIQLLRRVIKIAPLNLESRQCLIEILLNQGEVNDAIHEYLGMADVCYNLADLESAKKNYYQALQLAESTVNNRETIIQILYRIADIDLQSFDWRQALQIFTKIKEAEPTQLKARENLIELYIRLSQFESAEVELREYLELLADGEQRHQAISFLERAVQDYPNHVYLHRSLAHLYRLAGRYEDAIHVLDQVVEVLLDSGDREGAAQVIEEIVGMNPQNVQDYEKILRQLRAG